MNLKEAIRSIAPEFGLDPDLVIAMATVESNLNSWACRYEPNWNYYSDPPKWAKMLLQTEETERMHQATSWGALQVMGAVARELGFKGYLSQLSINEVGIRVGCTKLQSLFKKYQVQDDVISSYNQGNPKKGTSGRFYNQVYVDKVNAQLKIIKAN